MPTDQYRPRNHFQTRGRPSGSRACVAERASTPRDDVFRRAAEEEEKNIPDSLKSNIDISVKANIAHAVSLLRSSTPVLKPLVDKNEIKIIGAYYDLDSGKVLFDK